jgi:hypothetical protein
MMNSILVSIGCGLRVAIRWLHRIPARLGTRNINHAGSKSGWVQALHETRLISDRKAWAKSGAARQLVPPT